MPAGIIGAAAAGGLAAAGAGATAAGIGAAALAAGAASGISKLTSGSASGAIAGGQAASNRIAEQTVDRAQNQYNVDGSYIQNYVDRGIDGLNRFADASGANGSAGNARALSDFQASPGYSYQLQQGLKAVDQGAAANGLLRSGATLKAEQTLGTNLANQDFGNYVNRLNTLAGFGQAGTGQMLNNSAILNNLISGQATNQQTTNNSAAGAQATLDNNSSNQSQNTINSLINNGYTNYKNTGSVFGNNALLGTGTAYQPLAGGTGATSGLYQY